MKKFSFLVFSVISYGLLSHVTSASNLDEEKSTSLSVSTTISYDRNFFYDEQNMINFFQSGDTQDQRHEKCHNLISTFSAEHKRHIDRLNDPMFFDDQDPIKKNLVQSSDEIYNDVIDCVNLLRLQTDLDTNLQNFIKTCKSFKNFDLSFNDEVHLSYKRKMYNLIANILLDELKISDESKREFKGNEIIKKLSLISFDISSKGFAEKFYMEYYDDFESWQKKPEEIKGWLATEFSDEFIKISNKNLTIKSLQPSLLKYFPELKKVLN